MLQSPLAPTSFNKEPQVEEVLTFASIPSLPSTPPRIYHDPFKLDHTSPSTSSRLSSSPPSSPSLVSVTGSAASATSDADDIVFPLTPNSKKSTGECRIANTSLEAESPLTSHSPGDQPNDPFLSYSQASPPYGVRVLDKMIGNIIHSEGTSESVKQEDKESYLKQMGQLSANSFHLSIRVLEAIRERERMLYFASCWDVALFERQKDFAAVECELLKTNFLVVERELGTVLDILGQRLSSPRELATDGRHRVAVRENNMRSIRRADDVLAFVRNHGIPTE
ncbi:hypothetical protein P692DRAFT_20731547 [Suillus brevipes Sb2]|nr:hypothetical protein P692DRAFT_20731547 [Suillus brevipes Sb2]